MSSSLNLSGEVKGKLCFRFAWQLDCGEGRRIIEVFFHYFFPPPVSAAESSVVTKDAIQGVAKVCNPLRNF